MVIAKGLIFKSLLGIATSGVVIVPIVLSKLSNKKTEEDTADDTNKGSNQGVSDVSSSQTTINTGSQQTSSPGNGSNAEKGIGISTNTPTQPEEVDTLGIPKSCKAEEAKGTTKKTCELTKEQLGKILFETKGGGASITIDGLTNSGDKVELTIEDKTSDKVNYPKGKKYSFKAKNGEVKIKNTKDGEISITKDKEVVFREKQGESKLEKAPEEVDNLGIPKSCKADQAKNNSPQTCQLTQEQLGKIKFEPKSGGGSISVNGLTSGDKVTLTITGVSNDNNYPKGKKYNFKTPTQKTATITGTKENISITSAGIDFREKTTGDQLEKVTVIQKTPAPSTDSLGLPTSCKSGQVTRSAQQTCQLTVDDLKKVKFKVFDGKTSDTSVSSLESAPNNKIKLTISWDTDKSDYPDNKKYSFENTTDKDIEISKDSIKVKIAKKTKSWFKNESGKLALVETELDNKKEKKMKEIKDELTKIGLSEFIKLEIGDFKKDDKVDFEEKTAKLDERAMKSIQFNEFHSTPTDISGWNDKSKKIELKLNYTEDSNYPKNMKFSFQNNTGSEITIKNGRKSLKFSSNNQWYTFKVNNSELERTQGK